MQPKYLDISYESVGIRDSQKRLKGLIAEVAVQPIREFEAELSNNFELVETIIRQRIAMVIAYWCEHKHVPATPRPDDLMSAITNASKNDMTLREFYATEVKYAMHSLASTFGLNVRSSYEPDIDILVEALNQLSGRLKNAKTAPNGNAAPKDDESGAFAQALPAAQKHPPLKTATITQEAQFVEVEPVPTHPKTEPQIAVQEVEIEPERAIVTAPPQQVIEVKDTTLQESTLKITVEEAWQLIYSLIGYQGDYIQGTLLPRWQQNPAAFDKDRRFLYGLFLDTLRNAAGLQHISGNHTFKGRNITVDALWTHYFSDLAQNVAPQLTAAKLHNAAHDPWHKKLWAALQKEIGNLSPVWLIALGIALVLDALTTYISLDQTPMEGAMVLLFTVLITALFQIADQLVISYRKREFEAEAMAAKFHAQYEGLAQEVSKLPIASESYVQLSMNKSKSHADWKAAEDNRRMARRGRFWSARIADINVVVTAYGFSYLFLNSREPMVAVVEQLEAIFVHQNLRNVDPWVFLMVGLAITVSFVVNTAQRTEILGWSMRRLKREA